MFWLITALIIITIIIALFIFPELGKFALDLGTRLLKWDGIILIVVVIFIIFFMYAKNKQMENKQLELQAVLKQEELKQERQNALQKQKELPVVQSKEMQKQEAMTQEKSKEVQKQEPLAQQPSKEIQKKKETEDIQNLIKNWLKSWEEGNFNTYRTLYASNFQSKGKNLEAWISYKTDVHDKSTNIKIGIDDLQISVNENKATAVFIQHYSSSITKDSGKKTLELKKENNEWKIYREIM